FDEGIVDEIIKVKGRAIVLKRINPGRVNAAIVQTDAQRALGHAPDRCDFGILDVPRGQWSRENRFGCRRSPLAPGHCQPHCQPCQDSTYSSTHGASLLVDSNGSCFPYPSLREDCPKAFLTSSMLRQAVTLVPTLCLLISRNRQFFRCATLR